MEKRLKKRIHSRLFYCSNIKQTPIQRMAKSIETVKATCAPPVFEKEKKERRRHKLIAAS